MTEVAVNGEVRRNKTERVFEFKGPVTSNVTSVPIELQLCTVTSFFLFSVNSPCRAGINDQTLDSHGNVSDSVNIRKNVMRVNSFLWFHSLLSWGGRFFSRRVVI